MFSKLAMNFKELEWVNQAWKMLALHLFQIKLFSKYMSLIFRIKLGKQVNVLNE